MNTLWSQTYRGGGGGDGEEACAAATLHCEQASSSGNIRRDLLCVSIVRLFFKIKATKAGENYMCFKKRDEKACVTRCFVFIVFFFFFPNPEFALKMVKTANGQLSSLDSFLVSCCVQVMSFFFLMNDKNWTCGHITQCQRRPLTSSGECKPAHFCDLGLLLSPSCIATNQRGQVQTIGVQPFFSI